MIRLILYYMVFSLHVLFWEGLLAAEEKNCVPFDVRKQQCSENEICAVSRCECLPGFVRLNNNCIKAVPNPVPSPAPYGPPVNEIPEKGNSHVAAAVIIPIMLILVVIGSVVLARKYNVLSWVRNKINQRQTPYDEVMIGQDDDDPPLSGV